MNPHGDAPQEHPATTFAARLHAILLPLATLLLHGLKSLVAVKLCNRIARARQHLAALLADLAAGRAPRLHVPRPGRKGGPHPTPYIPQGRAWVFRTLHHDARRHDVAGHAAQLEALLNTPAITALLATAPPISLNRLARTLRPLCHLLGVTLPPLLRTAGLRPRAARPPAPKTRPARPTPHAGTPDRPLPRYVRLAARAWRKPAAGRS